MLLKKKMFVLLIINRKDVHPSNEDHIFIPDMSEAKSHRTVEILAQAADAVSCQAVV